MSASPTGRDRRPLIAVVLVTAAVAVGAFNFKTFGPARRPAPRAETRVQAYPALPADLEDVMRDTARLPLAGAAAAEAPLPALQRDPFVGRRAARTPPAVPAAKPAAAPDGTLPLACQAVLLGGGLPEALVDGHLVRAGDTVRGLRVAVIDVRGVTLQGAAGAVFLPVGGAGAADARELVKQSGHDAGAPRGGLVEYVKQERKLP